MTKACGFRSRDTAGRTSFREMKDTSITAPSRSSFTMPGAQVSDIRLFEKNHPRVLPKFPVKLAVTDVNRNDPLSPSLKQAVRETPCRGAHVQENPVLHIH